MEAIVRLQGICLHREKNSCVRPGEGHWGKAKGERIRGE